MALKRDHLTPLGLKGLIDADAAISVSLLS